MEKTFSINIPAEPYGEIDENAIAVNVTYNGPAYIVFSLDSNGNFYTMEGYYEDLSDFRLEGFIHDGHTFHILDANVNTFEAALLTRFYVNETVEDYSETLSSGEKVEFAYPPDGILNVFWKTELSYNPTNKSWSSPQRQQEPISNVVLLANIANRVAELETALANNTYTDDETTAINDWLAWGKAAATNYAGVAGWKIPYLPMPRY